MALNMIPRLLKRKDLSKLLSQCYKQTTSEALLIPANTRLFETFVRHKSVFLQSKKIYTHRFYSVKAAENNEDDAFRSEHNITVIGKDIPSPYTNIDESPFPDYIKQYLKNNDFTKPTVIQSQGWPIALSGQNFVGIAQTGTGKTLAYLLPAVVHIKEKEARKGRGPIALVLAPTRELARQIENVAKDFERSLGIRCVCIYGGANRNPQADRLQAGVDIVIATPGRLNDFLKSKVTTLCRTTYVVLDEADRMLDMGFEPQIREALEGVPLERQILMFSATWPREVQSLALDYLGKFVQVNVGSTELSANHNIQQHIHVCDQEDKIDRFRAIMHSITGEEHGKILVFANTKRFVDQLEMALKRNGWPAIGIHGNKTQKQRDEIIRRFKFGKSNILVATDVAARGLDVDGITHVLNYDFPMTSEDYIHRIGRTGRSDKRGEAHTLLTEEDARQAASLIAVLREANQEIPEELQGLASSYKAEKNKGREDRYNRFRPKHNNNYESNSNRRWNKFRSSSNKYY